MRTFRKHKRNGGSRRKSDQAIDKENTVSMLRNFELDYKQACLTKDPQPLEVHFKNLSNDHLTQLCNSAKITARTREGRIQALAAALLERQTAVRKALQVLMLIARFKGLGMLIGLACVYGFGNLATMSHGIAIGPLVIVGLFSLVWARDSMVTFIKSCKNFGTTKSKRRILRQMRQLHGVTK